VKGVSKKEMKRSSRLLKQVKENLPQAIKWLEENGTPAYWRLDKEGKIEIITIDPLVAKREGCTRAFLS
jgi:hypothetical protein